MGFWRHSPEMEMSSLTKYYKQFLIMINDERFYPAGMMKLSLPSSIMTLVVIIYL